MMSVVNLYIALLFYRWVGRMETEADRGPGLPRPHDAAANLLANGCTAFIWKLCSHWLKGLRQRQIAVVTQDPGSRAHQYTEMLERCFINNGLSLRAVVSEMILEMTPIRLQNNGKMSAQCPISVLLPDFPISWYQEKRTFVTWPISLWWSQLSGMNCLVLQCGEQLSQCCIHICSTSGSPTLWSTLVPV